MIQYGTMYCAQANRFFAAFEMFRFLTRMGADASHPDEVGRFVPFDS